MKDLGIGKATAQRLFDILTNDGFIVPNGSSGTFVSQDPPHLSNFGVVFPFSESALIHSRFYLGILYEIRQFTAKTHSDFSTYYQPYLEGSNEYLRLLSDMQNHRLAGVIFASDFGPLLGTKVMSLNDTPRVAIMSDNNSLIPDIPAVYPNQKEFIQKAIAHLAEAGRKRIAYISTLTIDKMKSAFHHELKQYQMFTQPYWQLQADPMNPSPMRNIMHCLMRLPAEDRPDGLIISDDNLVEETIAGLVDAGTHVPNDLTIVAHANYPLCPTSPLPVHWIGFDLQEVLNRCMGIIRDERQGATPPATSYIQAINYTDYSVKLIKPVGKHAMLPTSPSSLNKGAKV